MLVRRIDMKKELDARGKACPMPVVETNKVLKTLSGGDTVEVTVDNFIAVQNLSKMAGSKNCEFSSEKIDDDNYVVSIKVAGNSPTENEEIVDEAVCIPDNRLNNTVVAIASNKMGEGDEQLGFILMKGFIYALTEQDNLPQTVLLYNSGAKLSVEGSDSLGDLKILESQGVEILTCGTCLNYYNIAEKLSVGGVSNMYDITEKMMKATKILKP
jgi:selenium metabolism protein YedF